MSGSRLVAPAAMLLVWLCSQGAWGVEGWPKWLPPPPKLAAAPRDAVTVRTTGELVRELAKKGEGRTILLADGVYAIDAILILGSPGLTLRSASGDPARAVIDAADCRSGEALHIYADDVTVAEITIRNARFNGIKLEPERGGHRFRAYGCVFHNVWQRGLKCPLVPEGKDDRHPCGGRVEYCLFTNDRPSGWPTTRPIRRRPTTATTSAAST